MAHLTPQEAADTLQLGNMSPSKSSLDRLPKLLSSRWEEHREWGGGLVSVAVGCMARPRQRCRTGLAFRHGVLARLTVWGGPEAKKATLKEMLSAEVNGAGAAPRPEAVKLADAAPDNWNLGDAERLDSC